MTYIIHTIENIIINTKEDPRFLRIDLDKKPFCSKYMFNDSLS